MSLHTRTAIITGASQGLGRAIAEAFVQAGASVFLVARSAAQLQQTVADLKTLAISSEQQIIGMPGDVADPVACDAIVAEAERSFGTITALVNNAGVYGPMGTIETIDWQEWVKAIEVNLFGTELMTRAIIPHMRARGYGKIINLSGGGATAPLPRISAYAASKAAVVRLTETFAEELRDAHIDVNAVAPGALNTRLLDEVIAAGPERVGASFYQRSLKQRDEGGAPLEKGAALIVFLAAAASDGISGRLLSALWDDWEHLPDRRDELANGDIYTLRRIVPSDRGKQW